MKTTFSVIYAFHIKEEKEAQFIQAWKELTALIKNHEGGQGSRLHRKNKTEFLAYAQWPDRQTWEHSGAKMPEDAQAHRNVMQEACEKIEALYELEVVEDLLI